MTHFKSLLARIMQRTNDELEVETSTLFLYDKSTDELWSTVIQNSEISEIRIPSDKGLAGNVFKSGESILIKNAYEDPRFHREIDTKSGFTTRSVLCVPIVNKAGETIGVLQAINKLNHDLFSEMDLSKLREFSIEVANVIEKSRKWTSLIPGLLAVVGVTILAVLLHGMLPTQLQKIVGTVLVAISLGVAVNNVFSVPIMWIPGIQFALHNMLRFAIVMLGSGIAFHQAIAIGSKALIMIIALMIFVMIVVHVLAKVLKVPVRLATLIGVGTAICGNSAIAAVAPVIKAKEEDLTFAIATNTLLGTVAVFAFPVLGTYFGFTDAFFGTWAGVAVNDTAQAVAAGFAFSPQAGEISTVVKLTRNAMIVVVIVAVGAIYARWVGGQIGGKKVSLAKRVKQSIPGFVVGFLVVAYANTLGLFSWLSDISGRDIQEDLRTATGLLILGSLAGVGLGTNFKRMRATGPRPLYIGVAASLATGLGAFVLITLLGPATG